MRLKKYIIPFIVFTSLLLQGCATSRSEIKLTSAAPDQAKQTVATKGIAIIRSVKDERVFEQAPRNPSIPSLGFEGAEQATSDIKSRAIGRKRNSFGKALGDVLLENGQTVEGVVRDNLTTALRQSGYQVLSTSSGDTNALLIDVHINKFWAWFQPGFWSITLHTNIATTLDISNSKTPISIAVHAEDSRQIATDSAWIEIADKALQAYRDKVATTSFDSK